MEERKEVKEILVDFRCPKCGVGFLRPTGTCLTSYPPIFPHKCNGESCDYETSFKQVYPRTEYEEIEKL